MLMNIISVYKIDKYSMFKTAALKVLKEKQLIQSHWPTYWAEDYFLETSPVIQAHRAVAVATIHAQIFSKLKKKYTDVCFFSSFG